MLEEWRETSILKHFRGWRDMFIFQTASTINLFKAQTHISTWPCPTRHSTDSWLPPTRMSLQSTPSWSRMDLPFWLTSAASFSKQRVVFALRDVEGNLEALSVDYRTDWKFACCFGAFLNPVCMRNGPGVLSGRGSCDGGEPWCRKVQCPPAGGVDSEILWVPEALP